MTIKAKNKINGYYILLGLLMFLLYCYPGKAIIKEADLNTKTITLYRNIELLGRSGARHRPYYRFWTNETRSAFIIETPGITASKSASLNNLKKDDTLTIKYFGSDETDINDQSKEIPVYFLQKGDQLFFDTTAYNQASAAIDKRYGWLMLIGGLLLTLRGLTIIDAKTGYILAGLSAATILVLRIMNKF